MKHLKLTLADVVIDIDKLTFPPLIVGEYREGPRCYPTIVPAERVEELHGTGTGFDVRSLAATYVWRGESEPSAKVLAEVEEFNADPVRGWATLIREEAERNVEHWLEHLHEAQDNIATHQAVAAGAEALLAAREDRAPVVGDVWKLSGEPGAKVVIAEIFDDFVLGIPVTTSTASATEVKAALNGKPITLWPQVETGLSRNQLALWKGHALTEDEVRQVRRWSAGQEGVGVVNTGVGSVDLAELEALCAEYQRRCLTE